MSKLTPLKRRDYERWLKQYGWYLTKASIDCTLHDEQHYRVCTIKITHPGGEIPKADVHKTKKHLKERGLDA